MRYNITHGRVPKQSNAVIRLKVSVEFAETPEEAEARFTAHHPRDRIFRIEEAGDEHQPQFMPEKH